MKKKPDLSKVEEALKKAGEVALRGPREARNGRFTATDSTKTPTSQSTSATVKKK